MSATGVPIWNAMRVMPASALRRTLSIAVASLVDTTPNCVNVPVVGGVPAAGPGGAGSVGEAAAGRAMDARIWRAVSARR